MHKVTKSNKAYPWQNWQLWHQYIVTMTTLKLATNILTLNNNSNTDSITDNKNDQYLTKSTLNATFFFFFKFSLFYSENNKLFPEPHFTVSQHRLKQWLDTS